MPCSILHVSDMNYVTDRYCVFNRKGLLRANQDHQIIQVKKAYYAVQNVVSVFDGTVKPVLSERKFLSEDPTVSAFAFVADAGLPVLADGACGGDDGSAKVGMSIPLDDVI